MQNSKKHSLKMIYHLPFTNHPAKGNSYQNKCFLLILFSLISIQSIFYSAYFMFNLFSTQLKFYSTQFANFAETRKFVVPYNNMIKYGDPHKLTCTDK